MKHILTILSLLFCGFAFADTINLHWKNYDGTTYQDSTCVVDSDLILPSTPPTRYGYTFTGWKLANYIPIEYLESTGTQYIDTGIIPKDTIRVDISFLIPNTVQFNMFFGSRTTSIGFFALLFPSNNQNNIRVDYYNQVAMICASASSILGKRVLLEFNNDHKAYLYEANKNLLCRQNLPAGSFSENCNIFLFAVNNPYAGQGNIAFSPTLKIYSTKIYDNNTLVRDFIPVLDFTGTPCMYDRVTEQFFYNQGTGNFIAGPSL